MRTSKDEKGTSPTDKAKLTRIVERITQDSEEQEQLLKSFYFECRDEQDKLFEAIFWGKQITPMMEEAKEAYFGLHRQSD